MKSSKLISVRSCSILIPAKDEQVTITEVVRAALASELGPVLVVDDGSSDHTATVARSAGAGVLQLATNRGKGGAVYSGAEALHEEVVVLLDADLTGLTAEHIRALAEPVLNGRADMSRGVFGGGRWRTTAAQRITPQLNGQRAIVRKKLLHVENLAQSRYGIEIAITKQAKRDGWHTEDVPMVGVSQVMKEEKRGLWRGVLMRLRMYRDILSTLLRQSSH